jgi:hypothetical protein
MRANIFSLCQVSITFLDADRFYNGYLNYIREHKSHAESNVNEYFILGTIFLRKQGERLSSPKRKNKEAPPPC